MGAVELIGVAGSLSLLAGWRLYLVTFATGVAMRTGWLDLPDRLDALAVLANPWVIGAAFVGAVAEFFADKLAWVDSVWDAVHTVVRPLGGALISLAVVDASDPAWGVVAFLAGGGAAALSHGAKARARAAVNLSPEPYSNVAVSAGEDIMTGGLLALALASPVLAVLVALAALAFAVLLFVWTRRLLRRVRGFAERLRPASP